MSSAANSEKLCGALTALVTPMNRDGSVDFSALDALVDWQLAEGIDGLVPCGTTGESVTLTADERQQVIARVVEKVGSKVPVVAGTGGNDTRVAIEHQKRAKEAGAHYALVASPYYNKPTPEGLYRHYAALAEAVDIPIVLYNVPGRTACDMLPATVARLATLPGVVAIKEATADLDRVHAIRTRTSEDFAILSGDDASTFPFLCMGGDGVISVASNVAPGAFTQMVHAALECRLADARAQHHALSPLFAALFLESNPIPVKAALAIAGRIGEHYRLPLCEMQKDTRARLEEVLRAGKWI